MSHANTGCWTRPPVLFLIRSLTYPTDFSRHRPMTEEEAISEIRMAVLLKLRCLGSARPTKRESLASVLRGQGVEWFARDVAEQLILSNCALFRGPPSSGHSTTTAHGSPDS
jgi:hypothetical protein